MTRSEGERLCDNDFDGELLLFDTNSEVDGLIDHIKSGIYFNYLCGRVSNPFTRRII